jgi:serine protease Do
VRRISRFLFEENGFHGNRYDSDNRSNSYINEVLDDREGLPISLSVLFIELARRLGVQGVVGIPLPGRFMVGYRETDEDPFELVDVFFGGRFLTMQEGIAELADDRDSVERFREPASKRDILLRMVRNLMAPLAGGRGVAREAMPYLDLLIAIDPKPFRERLSRAMARETIGNRTGVKEDLEWLLEHMPEDPTGEKRAMLEQWLERALR